MLLLLSLSTQCLAATNAIVLDEWNEGDTLASFHLDMDSVQNGDKVAFMAAPDDAYCPIGSLLPVTGAKQTFSDVTIPRWVTHTQTQRHIYTP